LRWAFDAGNTVELATGNGDKIQLFGPGQRYFEFYRSHGVSIVPLLEVNDLDQASAELSRSGAELLGGSELDGTWTWLTFWAPDGKIHALAPAWRSSQVRLYAPPGTSPGRSGPFGAVRLT
jgi:hypothetical protein